MIQAYFGNGKGKTTAAIGAAIRCAGCKNSVLFVQFLKNNTSSEIEILETTRGIDVLFCEVCYKLYDNLDEKHTPALANAYNKLLFEDVKEKAKSYQMIVLDEVLDAIEFGYIDEDKFLKFLNELKSHTEIILTGHTLDEKIANLSDYISEIKQIKHPYEKGVSAREGIEY